VTRIVLDAMGSDQHPQPEIEAAIAAVERWNEPLILAGPRTRLETLLAGTGANSKRIMIADASEVLQMTDHGARAARGKADSSMAVGIDMLRHGQADAFVTAGNTGGAMSTALLRLGRLRGVKRPALAPTFPVAGGRAIVLDIGANVDCRPEYLAQFAVMGSVYAQAALGVQRPRIGLLSNGEEPGKGSTLIQEAFPMLEGLGLNFVGNVEPKEVYAGQVDVAVTDGFSGNIFLKTSEAVARFLIDAIRDEITAGLVTKAGGLLARPAFHRVRRVLDPAEYGAVPLLGVNGLVFIGHGRSDAKALVSAIAAARAAVEAGLLDALRRALAPYLAREAEPSTAARA
jgi:glycerol-3-phosphate acyltransferase PlsX